MGVALSGTSDTRSETVKFDPAGWTLAWAEEFDRDGAPDPAWWEPEQGYVRNREAQYYTTGRRENARVEGGVLVIEARRDDWQGRPITSASLTTRGKRSFLYGRIEVRAKIPTGRGTAGGVDAGGQHAGGGLAGLRGDRYTGECRLRAGEDSRQHPLRGLQPHKTQRQGTGHHC